MAIFDYKNLDTKVLMQDTLALNLYMAQRMGLADEMKGSFDTYNKDGAWRELTPDYFNNNNIVYNPDDNSYHGEKCLYWGVQASVLGKYDGAGNLTSIGVSFWGTGGAPDEANSFWNMLSDVLSYGLDIIGPENSIHSYVYNAFNSLMTEISNLAGANGLTGKDIIFTGHSQGGLCVNSMASGASLGNWNGFFEDSTYIALASPTQNNLNDKVLNFGLENDPVYRGLINDNITIDSLSVHDKALATCTNNLVSFNDYYIKNDCFSILNLDDWKYGHAPQWYESVANAILSSDFYSATNLNSNIIVANLSDTMRIQTWVEDLNYNAKPHSGPTFILGSEEADLIRGGAGIDYLEGNGGDDIFRDAGGFNIISGGAGNDTLSTNTQFDYSSFARDLFGNVWIQDRAGNVSILDSVENIKGGFYSWFKWHDMNGTFTSDGVKFSYDNVNAFKPYSTTANAVIDKDTVVAAHEPVKGSAGFLFGYMGNDTLIGTTHDEVFAANQGDDIISTGGGKDTIIVSGDSFGHDTIYQFGTDDKLVFLMNSQIETQESLYSHISKVGNDIVFNFNEDSSITLIGAANLGLDVAHQFIAA